MPSDDPKNGENTKEDPWAFIFWFFVWAGTTVAGGVFGFVFGWLSAGIFGLAFGPIYAGLAGCFGIPTITAVALITWCFWLSRFRVVMGGLAGGLTLVSMAPPPLGTFALAGLLGTLGGGLAGGWYHSRAKSQISQQHRWRFTLRDLFIRVTVISGVLGACVLADNLVQMERQREQVLFYAIAAGMVVGGCVLMWAWLFRRRTEDRDSNPPQS